MSNDIGFEISPGVGLGDAYPLLVIAGPCVIESEELCLAVAGRMKEICRRLGLSYVFKASYDKANRTSVTSFRGPGLEAGLEILRKVKELHQVPILTDVHDESQIAAVAKVADILQIPAFLCRQTDLLVAAGESGCVVNIKKGQFTAPQDMERAAAKVMSTGNRRVCLTERGTTFGYHNLVVDMRSLPIMRGFGLPVIFDATHSVQLPSGQGGSSGGQREFIAPLLRGTLAVGVDGLFMETHPAPEQALCDGPNSMPLDEIEELLTSGRDIHELVRKSR